MNNNKYKINKQINNKFNNFLYRITLKLIKIILRFKIKYYSFKFKV